MTEETTTTLRRCIGSARFGIEAHEAPVDDFPRQRSQKDGLGRMCRTHWSAYTAGLARDAKGRKATAEGGDTASAVEVHQDGDPAAELAAVPEPVGKPPRRSSADAADSRTVPLDSPRSAAHATGPGCHPEAPLRPGRRVAQVATVTLSAPRGRPMAPVGERG